jgi:hypothetical protein
VINKKLGVLILSFFSTFNFSFSLEETTSFNSAVAEIESNYSEPIPQQAETFLSNDCETHSEEKEEASSESNICTNIDDLVQKTSSNTASIKDNCKVIQKIIDKSLVFNKLTESDVCDDIDLNKSLFISYGEQINIKDNITIDGNGSSIIFSQSQIPQFVVDTNKTVILKNIRLSNINDYSFDIKGLIKIGENVSFELIEDITLSNGKLIIKNPSQILDDSKAFIIRGLGGKKKLILDGENIIKLGNNSIFLQNLELIGFEAINFSGKSDKNHLTKASIFLGGNTTVVVNPTETDSDGIKSTSLNFEIESENNKLLILENDMRLDGTISFSKKYNTINMVTIKVIHDEWEAKLRLNGSPGIFLSTSNSFLNGIKFTNPLIKIHLENSNAFMINGNKETSEHLLIKCNDIKFSGFPIKQLTPNICYEGNHISGKIDTSNINPKNEFFLDDNQIQTTPTRINSTLRSPSSCKKFNKKHKQEKSNHKKNISKDIAKEIRFSDPTLNANLNLPKSIDICYANINGEIKGAITGNIQLTNKELTNVFTENKSKFNLTVKDGTVVQAHHKPFVLSDNQFVNILGASTFKITNTFHINNNFKIANNAILIFEASNQGQTHPTIIIDENTLFSIPKNASVKFVGNLQVKLGNNTKINLSGEINSDFLGPIVQNDSIISTNSKLIDDIINNENTMSIIGPTLHFENGAMLSLDFKTTTQSISASISGVGSVEVMNGSGIEISPNSCTFSKDCYAKSILKIGFDSASDFIFMKFNNNSEVCIGNKRSTTEENITSLSQILTGLGTTIWKFNTNSKINIFKNGLLGFNIDVVQNNLTSDIILKKGYVAGFLNKELYIAQGGILCLGDNKPDINTKNHLHIPLTFAYHADPVKWFGEGKIIYCSTSKKNSSSTKSFEGLLQSPKPNMLSSIEMSLEEFAKFLIQIKRIPLFNEGSFTMYNEKRLGASIVYEKKDNKTFVNQHILRTQNGVSVPLKNNQEVLYENSAGIVTIFNSNLNTNSIISPDGTKLR